ncbi:HAD family hydrolase [Paenibacillus agricola]|uniref:HAD family hydrolase n=1 Tax=Paenibacillus agricola TaxID=2716264 RepID=A0ABX0JCB8_9BACL|nr:HAD family hydrolase [Paenibacillus agricola]NHN31854.1 HAD family hydrolase [Paenibacillus agricola]
MMKAIILDCYGTLVSTGNGSITATEQILQRNRIQFDAHEFYRQWKYIHHTLCATVPFRLEADAFLIGLKKLYETHNIEGNAEQDVKLMLQTLGRREAFPEVHEVIAELSTRFQLVIGSNSDHEPLLADLSRNTIHIPTVFSSESLCAYKPNIEFFAKMLAQLSLQPEEVYYVGDSQIDDILGSNKLGVESIWINRKKETLFDGIPKPKFECKDLTGLLSIRT